MVSNLMSRAWRTAWPSLLFLVTLLAASVHPVSAQDATPAITPAGPEPLLLYQGADTATGSARLFTMHTDGSGVTMVTGAAEGWSKHPDWSSDGSSIAFIKEGDGSIWTMNPDGSNKEHLFSCSTECAFADYAVWSNDGTQIAFAGYTGGTSGPPDKSALLVLDVATGKVRTLVETDLPLLVDTPQWSPDDSEIVLAVNKYDESFAQAGSALATVPAQGGDLTYLTDFDSFAYYPAWNTVTNVIAFSTETYADSATPDIAAKAWNLYTINPDGTGLAQLTNVDAGLHMIQPSWTPDGTKIVATLDSGDAALAAWVDPTSGAVTTITTITTDGRQAHVQLQTMPAT